MIPLYRIWDKEEERYTDWFAVHTVGCVVGINGSWGELDQDNFVKELSTQRQDKNGVDIYEGDICKGLRDTVFVICYDKDYMQFRADLGGGLHREIDYYGFKKIEVIGNVNNNPELLK